MDKSCTSFSPSITVSRAERNGLDEEGRDFFFGEAGEGAEFVDGDEAVFILVELFSYEGK